MTDWVSPSTYLPFYPADPLLSTPAQSFNFDFSTITPTIDFDQLLASLNPASFHPSGAEQQENATRLAEDSAGEADDILDSFLAETWAA
jgi:hypothetical protein